MNPFKLITMQGCGLVLLSVILIFMLFQKNLKDYKRRLFLWVAGIAAASLVLDVLSVYAIMNTGEWPQTVIDIFAKAYTLSLTWAGWVSYVYMLNVSVSRKKFRVIVLGMALMNLAVNIAAAAAPIETVWDGRAVYSTGLSDIIVYSCAALYFVLIFASCIVFRKTINFRYRFAMLVWDFTIFAACMIQLLVPELLLISFGLSLGVLILFITVENPQSNLDKTLGCFNSYAFHNYFEYLTVFGKSFSCEKIFLDNDKKRRGGSMPGIEPLRDLCERLNRIDKIYVFKDNEYALLIIADKAEKLSEVNQKIIFPYLDSHDTAGDAEVLRMDAFDGIHSSVELMQLFDYVRDNEKIEAGKEFLVGTTHILKYTESIEIVKEIDEALEEDRVEVYYQPIFNYENNCFTAAEALCRIRKRDGTMLSPGIFIPVAEKSDRIIRLGERVIDKTCKMIKEREIASLGIKYIEINLSVVQCENGECADSICRLVNSHDIKNEHINWEITESASVGAKEQLLSNIFNMVEKGFGFSLDDFGKGESNLMYIVEMPVSIVKLDMDMTKAFFESKKAKEVLRAVVRMVHKLGLKVVCEGVESAEEAETLYYENVDFIQGYYYSRPLPENEFVEIVRQAGAGRTV